MNPRSHQIIVVGAGLAGLSASAYLSRAGYEVLLLDQRDVPGGLLTSYEVQGFTFDGGARSIENSGVIRPMIEDLGLEVELLDSHVSIGIDTQLIDMEDKGSIEAYRKMIEQLFPEHTQDIQKIFRAIKKVYREMEVIYGFDNPVFKDFMSDKKFLFTKMLPWLARFVIAVIRMNRMSEPIERYLERLSDSRALRDIIDQHFFRNTPMFFALGYFYVYTDYLYPKGGTGSLTKAMAEAVSAHSGRIEYGRRIVGIDCQKQTVRCEDSSMYAYERLIWCADLKSLYRMADTSGLDDEHRARIKRRREELYSRRGGDSVFTLCLGVDMPPEYFEKITRAHLFYTPSPLGLDQLFRSDLTALLEPETLERTKVAQWVEEYCKRTTYEVSIPSLRDRSLSPAGKTGLIISFLFEYDLIDRIVEEGWYDQFRESVESSIIRVLDGSIFPNLSNSISLRFSSSPCTIAKMFSTSEGGINGWSFLQSSPVVDSLQKIPKAVMTPIPHVYKAGQWAYCPAGIPTAILTGWYAYDAILKDYKKS